MDTRIESDVVFSAHGLVAGYPNKSPTIDNLNFSIRRGEFVSLVGPSGVGKTTLLRAMSGLITPLAGKVALEGQAFTSPPPHMTMVFQDYSRSLLPWMSASKNIELILRKRTDLSAADRRQKAHEALDTVGLGGGPDRYPWQLSGGMQQRVAIARALAFEPHVLLMDEPFASVDAMTRSDLEDLVLKVRSEFSMTIVLVTHDIDEAIYMSDRILLLGGAPASIQDSLDVPLGPQRDQIATKASPVFQALRHDVFSWIHSNSVSESATP